MEITRAFFISLLFYCLSNQALASLSPNGSAVYQDLGREVFIGTLFLTNQSKDASQILNSDGEIKLQVAVLDTLSRRRWVSIWMQGMAINNPDQAFESQANNLVELFDYFKTSLKKQDVFQVHYLPGIGTTVFLNDIPLMQIPGKEMIHLFLRTWIGPVPPSTHYKEMILGQADSTPLLARVSQLKPSPERKKVIEAWLASDPQSDPQEAAPAGNTASTQTPAPEKPVAKELEAPVAAGSNTPEATQDKTPDPEPPASPLTKDEPSPQNQAAPKPEAQQVAAAEKTAVDATTTPGPVDTNIVQDDLIEENTKISVASLLASRQFTNQVIQKIYSNIKYPSKAITRNQQGTVRLNLTIERNGAIYAVDIEEASGFALLDNAALAAIEKSASFPPIPEVINEVPQTLSIPISFRLAD